MFRLPVGERRADPQAGRRDPLPDGRARGRESVLQPLFQFCLQFRLKQIPLDIVLPLPDGWRLFPAHRIQL